MSRPSKYPPELRERAIRTALESGGPVSRVARDLSIHPETLRSWIRQAEADSRKRKDLLSSDERAELKELKREVRVDSLKFLIHPLCESFGVGFQKLLPA